nr:hypothetical protein [Haloferax sp. ATB1]
MSLDDHPRWQSSSAGVSPSDVTKGVYTWADFMHDHGYGDQVSDLYVNGESSKTGFLNRFRATSSVPPVPHGDDWDRVAFDPSTYLASTPTTSRLDSGSGRRGRTVR